jgi:hypothetical protein
MIRFWFLLRRTYFRSGAFHRKHNEWNVQWKHSLKHLRRFIENTINEMLNETPHWNTLDVSLETKAKQGKLNQKIVRQSVETTNLNLLLTEARIGLSTFYFPVKILSFKTVFRFSPFPLQRMISNCKLLKTFLFYSKQFEWSSDIYFIYSFALTRGWFEFVLKSFVLIQNQYILVQNSKLWSKLIRYISTKRHCFSFFTCHRTSGCNGFNQKNWGNRKEIWLKLPKVLSCYFFNTYVKIIKCKSTSKYSYFY